MEIEVWVALVAAIATMLSAGFIGWQAWETRRSAASSNRAAEVSELALAVANESLALNRRQAEHATFMAIGATRARLEASTPGASMEMWENPLPILYRACMPSDRDSNVAKWVGDTFQLPQDEELEIYALFHVIFRNDGLVPVIIRSGSTLFPWQPKGDEGFISEEMMSQLLKHYDWVPTFRLEVGDSRVMYLAVGTSLKGWTETPGDKTRRRAEAGWGTELNGDSGVRWTQTVHIDGTLLEPGGKEGEFTIRDLGRENDWPSSFVEDQPKLTYWLGGKEVPHIGL